MSLQATDKLKERLEYLLAALRERPSAGGVTYCSNAALVVITEVAAYLGGDLGRVLAEIHAECRKAAEEWLKEEADEEGQPQLLEGLIMIGDRLIWRGPPPERIVVIDQEQRGDERWILTRSDQGKECWNDRALIREMCVRAPEVLK